MRRGATSTLARPRVNTFFFRQPKLSLLLSLFVSFLLSSCVATDGLLSTNGYAARRAIYDERFKRSAGPSRCSIRVAATCLFSLERTWTIILFNDIHPNRIRRAGFYEQRGRRRMGRSDRRTCRGLESREIFTSERRLFAR